MQHVKYPMSDKAEEYKEKIIEKWVMILKVLSN